MTKKTERIPYELDEVFARASETVSEFFANRLHSADRGVIEVAGERYVLVRAASLSVKFFALVRELYGPDRREAADEFARNILFDLAHAIGKSDAASFLTKMDLPPFALASAGPIHFANSGWGVVDFTPQVEVNPEHDRHYFIYDHVTSFEADAWLQAGEGPLDFPVCVMASGYSSGWSEACYGLRLVASEVLCRAQGDETCRFIMSPPEFLEERVANYLATRAAQKKPHRSSTISLPDLFARKRIEDELRRARDELEEHVRERTMELTVANELLKREMAERALVERQLRQASKLEAIGRLAGGISHDFNNLLAVILTRTDLLLRRLSRISYHPEVALSISDVEEIRKAGERAAKLTRQLLAFSRAQVLHHETLDLSEILTDLSRTMMPLIGEDVVLMTNFAEKALHVHADRGQIEQAIMNLVVNARDAMPQGGTLTIETAPIEVVETTRVSTGELRPGKYNVITIIDTGSGMSEELLSQIFDPFFTTKPEGKGTGLGLSTVYGMLQQSHGGIDVVSAPNKGTTFAMFLPAVDPGARVETKPSIAPPKLSRGTETVLLVEDQSELRHAIAEVLTECGYEVHEADTAHDALFLAECHPKPIDLLLTDVVMPKMGGAELAQRVLASRPDTRVLFMSGYAPDTAIHEAIARSGAALLMKPFRPEELSRSVREVLDAPNAKGIASKVAATS